MNFIVAVDENWNIGMSGALLEPIPADLKQFKNKTRNKVVVLGRKTLQTFPGGRPLKGRTNIILTRQEDFSAEGALICHSYEELFLLFSTYEQEDIFIIGGGEIYRELIPYCHVGYITRIHKTYPADTGILNLDQESNWSLVEEDGPHHYKDDIFFTYLKYHNGMVYPIPLSTIEIHSERRTSPMGLHIM